MACACRRSDTNVFVRFLTLLVAIASLLYPRMSTVTRNHLDMESIDALVGAVKDYRGGLVVVSHDEHFMSNCCSELWVVGEGHVTRFKGGFDEYKKDTLERTSKRIEESVKLLSTINN